MQDLSEIIGFVVAAVLASSLTLELPRVGKWIQLAASLIIALYGFVFSNIGIGIVGAGIFSASLYKLKQSLAVNESFNILQIRGNNEYLNAFIEYYKREIYHYSPFFKRNADSTSFLILNNLEIVGVLIVTILDKKILYVNLDFVIPKYRNNRVGQYLFVDNLAYFSEMGYEKIVTVCLNPTHKVYLLSLGFTEQEENGELVFVKNIPKK